jgi:hypothetical protein
MSAPFIWKPMYEACIQIVTQYYIIQEHFNLKKNAIYVSCNIFTDDMLHYFVHMLVFMIIFLRTPEAQLNVLNDMLYVLFIANTQF